MQASLVSFLLVSSSLTQYYRPAHYSTIKKDEVEYQQQAFKQWWGNELTFKLADLPTEGTVPDFRVPYAGHDYPDRAGGTMNALSKYDRAFHGGRHLATEFERMDVREHRGGRPESVRGLFGRMRMVRGGTPTWYGHCNGWTAAAIRHAEPQMNVVRNGVVFTPADIKGLLAELYMYTESEFLGGVDMAINPATLHVSLANWLGRGSHPIGMETAVGEVVINFPIYSYKSTVRMMSPREAEVRTTIRYTLNTPREYDKGPANFNRQMYFHYALHLDEEGEIKGGHYYGDSAQIDMLWAPLKPTQGGEEGNKRGNRHLNMKEVLAIWRESVPEDLRKQWLNIDPTEEDRILPPVEAVASSSDAPAAGTAASTSSGSEASASSADGADAAEIPPLPPGRPTAASETTAADPAPAAAPTPAVTPATPTTAGEGNGSSSPERNSAGDEDAPPQ